MNVVLVLIDSLRKAHGEHGYTSKPSYVLWHEITDVPFFVRHPGGKVAGERSDYHAWARDEDHVMFARNDGSEAMLFGLKEYPYMQRSVAAERQEILDRTWNDHVLGDAGGPLPQY